MIPEIGIKNIKKNSPGIPNPRAQYM